jgi:hypothetical protein
MVEGLPELLRATRPRFLSLKRWAARPGPFLELRFVRGAAKIDLNYGVFQSRSNQLSSADATFEAPAEQPARLK